MPMWGYAASPLIVRDWVIVQPGGLDGWSVVALDAKSGEIVWHSLSDEAGYTWPIVVHSGGVEQLVLWTPSHVRGVELATGKPLWEVPYEITYGVAIATPIAHEGLVVVSGYWHGSKAIRLGETPDAAKLEWEENRYLRGLMSQALYKDGLVYLLDKQYGITCFELATGNKLWDDENRMTPRGRNPQASLVWIGESDRVLALNSDGELVQSRFTRERSTELARSKIIGETWAHPAYAGKRVFARSDSELVCVELP
jgi:outer membrane protein assembly factor BamB